MPVARQVQKASLPGRFEDLVRLLPPQAIMDDVQYENTLETIDRLLAIEKLTTGQSLYLETLVELIEAYEAAHHAIDTQCISGLATLKHLLAEHEMTATDLARLLGSHPSMGSKILKGHRSLTIDHLKKLSARFKINPEIFIDWRGATRRSKPVRRRPRRPKR